MKRTLLGIGLLAAGAAIFLSGRRRRRRSGRWDFGRARGEGSDSASPGGTFIGVAGERLELEPASLVVIRGAHDEVNVNVGDEPHVVVSANGNTDVTGVLHVRRDDDTLFLMVHPRCKVDVTVPPGTAVRLQVAKSRSTISGVDGVEVFSAKGSLTLRDVAGHVRIHSAMEDIDVELSAQRETSAVDVMMAKGKFALTVPAARGGVYRVDAAKTTLSAPPSVDGGVPVHVRAAKSDVSIRAA
jgi:hypothetical protein